MPDLKRLMQDIEEILTSGINHTGMFMEQLAARGWQKQHIMPAVYQLLLANKLDPNGNKTPYKTN